jgi:pimeloyl-ACP methyl ester carboxylesterase
MSQVCIEPHSTKQIEDGVSWGLKTTPEVLIATRDAPFVLNKDTVEGYTRSVRCPVLVIHGDEDAIVSHTQGSRLAQVTGGTLVIIEGGGTTFQV